MADKLSIQGTKYDLIDCKPSTTFCLKIGNQYAVLTPNKPAKSGYTLKATQGSTVVYLNDPIKPMSKIVMKRQIHRDKGNWWSWAKFYNNSNQLICTVSLWSGWGTAEGKIDTSLSDQSIRRCHLYYYQDTRSDGWCSIDCSVVDVEGQSHKLFYGRGFKNHGHGDNIYLGVGQSHNWKISESHFPMELRY